MAVVGDVYDCGVLYGVREVHLRALNADGSVNSAGDWYATDCPVEISLDPEVEEGAKNNLKCGDTIKNTVRTDDQLTGMTVKFSMGCDNPEVEYIVSGSVGTVEYDITSPECAIGFTPPTLAQQENAVPFEMKIYRAFKDGSNDDGFQCIQLYQCLPSFVSMGGSQEEYSTQEWSIAAVENPSYGPAKPVYSKTKLASIPA